MAKSRRRKSAAKPRRLSHTRPAEGLEIAEWQVALRRQYGAEQAFTLENLGDHPVFSEFAVHNPGSGATYRVAIRGAGLGVNFCACPDFATNLLGTCKHIEFALTRLRRRRGGRAALRRGFEPDFSEVFLHYGARRDIRFNPGRRCTPALLKRARSLFDENDHWRLPVDRLDQLDDFLAAAGRSRHEVRCYDDVLAFAAARRDDRIHRDRLAVLFPEGPATPALRDLLAVPLYPYQCEGALFAARQGRAIIADEMGLGKTVQAIATAEILLRHLDAERVLVVCPTSLKHQWHEEIARLAGRDAEVVGGSKRERARQFATPTSFKITNYDTLRLDLDLIGAWAPDLVIADEAQRIKNWDTKAARAMKRLASPYALVLTGTPLENRLRELVSIVQFVDQHRLGPTWRFLERHQVVADTGQVVGYRHLDEVSTSLAPILIRRRKAEVLDQLPPRREKIYRLPLTAPQRALHEESAEIVARIVARWKRRHVLSDGDQKRLMAALQNMRMVCDSTYLVDGRNDHGRKIPELMRVLEEWLTIDGVKAVIFSQWLRSHELLARALEHAGHDFVLFHGGVPGQRRGALVKRFRDDPNCRVFLSTDAGGVGLNLQCASVVMNLDLPWNPAVLEQRIGRVHRLGQHHVVQVLNFVAEDSIEQNLMRLLAFKQSLAAGILDGGEAQLHLGGSRLNRFMEGVERAISTEAVEPPTPEHTTPRSPTATEAVAESHGTGSDRGAPSIAGDGRDGWQPLLDFAQAMLSALARQPVNGEERSPGNVVRRDPRTGERYLHLPLPDKDKMTRLIDALRDVLAG